VDVRDLVVRIGRTVDELFEYGYSTELVRFSLVAGAVVGLFLYERFGIAGGGIVLAGYLALFVRQPSYILFTFGIALVTWFLVTRVAARYVVLWGRDRLGIMIFTAAALAWLTETVWGMSELPIEAHAVGIALPALLANDFQRQGVIKTSTAAGVGITITFALLSLMERLMTSCSA
jgi:poly-gamma-glutamate biosynthesis protein PgsC/CapC